MTQPESIGWECIDYQVREFGEWRTVKANIDPRDKDRIRATVPAHWREDHEYRFVTEIFKF